MEQHTVITEWTGDMAFESQVNSHHVKMDADEKFGGKNTGPRPKPLLLSSLAGCTGMDVVSLLNKMRVNYQAFQIEVLGELTAEHPKYYHKIHIKYQFKGSDLPIPSLKKAIDLSQDKYCGVSAMLKKAADITYEIQIIN